MNRALVLILLSITFVAYTNCGEGFSSSQTEFVTQLSFVNNEVDLSQHKTLRITLENGIEINAWSQIVSKKSNFENNDPLKIPQITYVGNLCFDELIDGLAIKINRYIKLTNSISPIETQRLFLSSSAVLLRKTNRDTGSKSCYTFDFSSYYDELKVKTSSVFPTNLEVTEDYFFMSLAGKDIRSSVAEDIYASKVLDSDLKLSPYKLPEVKVEMPEGVWGDWVEKQRGNCVDSQRKIFFERVCESGKSCIKVSGGLDRQEEKVEIESCVLYGDWSEWVETKVGACINSKQTYRLVRNCEDGKVCKSEGGEDLEVEQRNITRDCQVDPNPNNRLKPLISKDRNSLRILFVGNSFQASIPRANGQEFGEYRVFRQVIELVKTQIPNATGKMISIGGGTLKQHWDESQRRARNDIASGNYDLLVIQGRYYDFNRSNYVDEFNNYADRFAQLAKSNGMKVMYYGLWARDQLISPAGDTYGPLAHNVYLTAAKRHNFSYAPNGMAYGAIYKHYLETMSESQVEEKLTVDSIHPNLPIGYMAAQVVYSTLFAEQGPLVREFKPAPISNADAELVRDLAWKAVQKFAHSAQ